MKQQPIPKPDLEVVFEHYGARILQADNGGWRKAECPLTDHDDKNPSASVNTEACRWHCWTCDESGDAVDIVRINERTGVADAIRRTSELFGAGDGSVREERGRSGLLPGGSGNRSGRGSYSAPWTRL